MAKVELKKIGKVYEGNVRAVEEANITINDKEFVVFVGPSGCGKSTTLRMVAGLEDISEGELLIDGKIVNDVPPKDRDIAMVFQNYALYPHMTVYDNMAFGLKIRKIPKAEIDTRVREAARILDIEKLLDRRPKQLSGGQRQRVAVGRAIVRNPKVFLFDEPLSNLDAKLRVQMRAEIIELHDRLQATMIYVTHDQVEAMTMGDKIVVMRDGKVQQIGSPLYLYNHPINKFVAGFIGSPPMNFLTAKVIEEGGQVMLDEGGFKLKPAAEHLALLKPYVGKEVSFGIRPEDIPVSEGGSAPNGVIKAKVTVVEPLGAEIHLYASTSTQPLVAKIPPHHLYKSGDAIAFAPVMEKARYFDRETELSILPVKFDEQA
ncbi:MAG: sn-glycerol-3-phosphate ABC transporter ATP-binding protein UgpC [Spirochaetaceae bacterium]|nr:sn-glycerol-3-phosphate ABC transporter ATP-binding protein UgpC [Spirochaetaceae bacterium]